MREAGSVFRAVMLCPSDEAESLTVSPKTCLPGVYGASPGKSMSGKQRIAPAKDRRASADRRILVDRRETPRPEGRRRGGGRRAGDPREA
jgi:hypothetical protein